MSKAWGNASAQPPCNTKFTDPSPPGLTTWARRREALGADEFDSHKTVEQAWLFSFKYHYPLKNSQIHFVHTV